MDLKQSRCIQKIIEKILIKFMADFVHLHAHTEFSLLDGLAKIPKLVARVKDLGMKALAITDHGGMYGVVHFYLKCKEEGIKPIIGVETYVARRSHLDKEAKVDVEPYHLLLLAKNEEGYKNLLKLVSIAHLDGYYYKPRIDMELLEKYREGIIATSACLQGQVAKSIREGDLAKARKIAGTFSEIMGDGNFYLELQDHPTISDQGKVNEEVVKISQELGLPLIATNDSHYVMPDDAEAQEVLLCVQTQKTLNDKNRPLSMIDSPDFYIKTPEQMLASFLKYPEALKNTLEIAEKCNVELKTGSWILPKFDVPDGFDGDSYLRKLAEEGLSTKISSTPSREITERLNYELNIIAKKGYSTYFLIVADFVNWARNQVIIATTRGSAAGSLVSYLIGITTVNPLDYGLPFERFLTLDRPLPPDIDMDFADLRRGEVIDYVKKKYGEDHVAQIITFGTMEARGAVRDAGRVLGMPYSEPDKIAKLIPLGAQGFPMNIQKALEITPELNQLYKSDEQIKRLLTLAQKLEGVARHASTHAAGVVISPKPLTEYTPIQRESKGENIITQYDMYSIEPLGLLKMDFLGIRNLSILGSAVEILKRERDIEIDLQKLPLDDKKAYEMLWQGDTMGVFQLGGSGMTRYVKELKPTSISDLAAMVALFRPGPMDSIPEFIERKHARRKVKLLDPRMEEILSQSYGVITYQDDVLMIAVKLAGYTWVEADKLRKAIGKKIPSEMKKQKQKFIEGCVKNGMKQDIADKLWELIEPFAGYGFNKAHAVAYGLVAYQTAYVKSHFPVEFMTALLTAESQGSSGPSRNEKVGRAILECRKMGIKVLSPDVNLSNVGFTIEKNENDRVIRFGLSAIKNVGEAAIETSLHGRSNGKFISLVDFCRRVDLAKVNKKTLESLIKAGALDLFGTRASMLASLDTILTMGHREKKLVSSGQESLFSEDDNQDGSSEFKLKNVEEFDKRQLLSFEKELFGFYLTEHPMLMVLSLIRQQTSHSLGELNLEHVGKTIKVGGIITEIRKIFTKNGNNEMAIVKIEDDTGSIEAVVFPKIYSLSHSCWIVDQVVIINGRVDNREERLSLIVESASSLNQFETSYSSENIVPLVKNDFEIFVPKSATPHDLENLNALLKKYPGNDFITLVLTNTNGEKRISVPFGISLSETLKKEINDLWKVTSST